MLCRHACLRSGISAIGLLVILGLWFVTEHDMGMVKKDQVLRDILYGQPVTNIRCRHSRSRLLKLHQVKPS